MSRNNADRFGSGDDTIPQGGADAPITNVITPTPDGTPLAFSIPTEHIELPSQGIFYPENHPLYKEETIEIKYMTAKEEDILTSPSLMKKGLTIDRLLKSLIINKSIDQSTLLTGDRNAIVIAARRTGYGEDYSAQINCPSCFETAAWSINLNELEASPGGIEGKEGFDVSVNEDGGFTINLPKSGINVGVKLLTGKDEQNMSIIRQKRKKRKLGENLLTEHLKLIIVSVNGSTQYTDIENFVDFIPAFDSKYLRKAYAKIMPNVNMEHNFICDNCDHEGTLEVPLTAEFFWPK